MPEKVPPILPVSAAWSDQRISGALHFALHVSRHVLDAPWASPGRGQDLGARHLLRPPLRGPPDGRHHALDGQGERGIETGRWRGALDEPLLDASGPPIRGALIPRDPSFPAAPTAVADPPSPPLLFPSAVLRRRQLEMRACPGRGVAPGGLGGKGTLTLLESPDQSPHGPPSPEGGGDRGLPNGGIKGRPVTPMPPVARRHVAP